MAGQANIPEEVQGFGQLGRAVRALRSFVLRYRINEILIERLPPGIAPPNNAEMIERPSGTTVKIKLSSGGAGAASIGHFPWEISVDNTGNVSVRPGTVNSLVPSNVFSSFGPMGTNVYYVKAHCLSDGKNITSMTIEVDTTSPPGVTAAENVTPSDLYDVLGVINSTFDGSGNFNGQIYQVRFGNLSANPDISFLSTKTPTNPGDEPFDRWWVWSLTEFPAIA